MQTTGPEEATPSILGLDRKAVAPSVLRQREYIGWFLAVVFLVLAVVTERRRQSTSALGTFVDPKCRVLLYWMDRPYAMPLCQYTCGILKCAMSRLRPIGESAIMLKCHSPSLLGHHLSFGPFSTDEFFFFGHFDFRFFYK